jgi:ribose transport system permease protein
MVGLLAVLGLFISVIAVQGQLRQFLSSYNVQQVLHDATVPGVVALGMLLVILSGGIDLSVGSVVALVTVVTVRVYIWALARTGSPALASLTATAAGFGTGGLCGLINGLTITLLRLTPFVATLGMMSIARGVAFWLSDKGTIMLPHPPEYVRSLQSIGNRWLYFDPGVYSLALLAVVTLIVLRMTVFGRYCYAIGSNEATARLCGINVEVNKVAIYVLAGLLTGWAGVLTCAQTTSGDPKLQMGLELDVIAAVVIGGASLTGGQGTVSGTLLGVLILAVLQNGVVFCGVAVEVKYILIGVIVLINTALSQWQRRRNE